MVFSCIISVSSNSIFRPLQPAMHDHPQTLFLRQSRTKQGASIPGLGCMRSCRAFIQGCRKQGVTSTPRRGPFLPRCVEPNARQLREAAVRADGVHSSSVLLTRNAQDRRQPLLDASLQVFWCVFLCKPTFPPASVGKNKQPAHLIRRPPQNWHSRCSTTASRWTGQTARPPLRPQTRVH